MSISRHLLPIIVGAVSTFGAVTAAFAATDFNNDGYDDVWQQKYGVTLAEFPLGADNDGDGCTNFEESLAGTNPGDPNDCLKVGSTAKAGNVVTVKVLTKVGKRYQLQSRTSLTTGTWTDEGAPVTGNGTLQSFPKTVASTDPQYFFHVQAGDQDTDGDGVSDYAEALTGTNPNLATTSNNASGGTVNDYESLRGIFSVTASVITPDAFEKGDINDQPTSAKVRFTRNYGAMKLNVPIELGGASDITKGSASASDYTLSGASSTLVSIAASGTGYKDVTIAPVQDQLAEVPETLKFSVKLPGLTPTVLSPTAAITIKDATVTPAHRRLFVAYLGREAGVTTTASGVGTALVEGDNDSALINLNFSNLSSVQNTTYIRVGAGLEVQFIPPGQVTSFSWLIRAKQYLQTDQAMLTALGNGSLYLSVSSANFTAGEIRGTFQLSDGSIADPPAPEPPPAFGSAEYPNLAAGGVTNNPTLDRDIARFLMQASYGPTPESIQEVRDLITANGNDAIAGYTAWINKQMDLAQTPSPSLMKLVQAADLEEFLLRNNRPSTIANDPQFGGNAFVFSSARTWVANGIWNNNHPFHNNRRREWWTLVLNSRDQLRQRMAMALHEIVVIGENDTSVQNYHYGTANYWDMLAANAFGTYRTILENATYSPMMGVYLSHLKNQRRTGTISPDENYAREIQQLFSVGLVLRHPNGSLKLDPDTALPIPTYDQADITEMARVMTGLSFGRRHNPSIGPEAPNVSFSQGNGQRFFQASWTNPMKVFASTTAASNYHDFEDYTSYNPTLTLPAGVTAASKILFRDKVGQTVIPPRGNGSTPQTGGTEAAANLDIADAVTALANHPNTPVFISRLLIQRFTTANPSAGYIYRVTQKYQQTGGNLGEVVKAILLDYEARSLSIADSTATAGKPKEPILNFAAMLRALKCYTGVPLVNLTTFPVTTFTAADSWITTPYDTAELNKFPAGTKRFRFPNTDGTLGQSPQDSPSVFNWFLPDYVLPGPLALAGLVAPEFQLATESNVINVVNYNYNVLFTSIPPGTTNLKPGYGVDGFLNLATYQTAGGKQLTVPAYGLPYDASSNPTGVGYFSAPTFDASPSGTETGTTIDNSLDNVLPEYADLTTLYTTTYTQKLVALYAPAAVPASPSSANKILAHDAATLAVLDQCDLLFSAGFFKAKYGSLPAGTASPRKAIIDALTNSAGGDIGNRTAHTTDPTNGFLVNAQTRCKNIAYLVLTSPYALILK